MNRLTVALTLLIAGQSLSCASATITLVDNQQAHTAIFVSAEAMAPDKPDIPNAFSAQEAEAQRRRLRESVRDLAYYLEKISGAKIEVVTSAPAAGDKRLPLLIGDLAEATFGPPKKPAAYRQGFRVIISAKGIGLIGESDLATSYSVYELLERLGCRWYLPSDLGEVIPSRQTLALAELDFSSAPGTLYRGVWYADDAFKRRIRQGGLLLEAAHALEIKKYIPKEQLEAHPDWRGRGVDGEPTARVRFCWANAEAAAAVADGIVGQLDERGSPTVSISPDDGMAFCECEKCRALDAGDLDPTMGIVSITDRFIHFGNQIAEGVTKKYPDVLLGFIAYVQYTRPPVREKVHPNLVPEIAPISYCRAHSFLQNDCPSRPLIRSIVEGWAGKSGNLSIYRFMYNLAEVTAPYPMMKQMSDELPFMYAHGVNFWQPETMPNFESVLPGMVLANRLAWDTSLKPADELDEFFTKFYGAAAAPMRRYWQLFDDAWTTVSEHAGCGFGYPQRFTPALLKQARAAMNEAHAACRTDLEKRRVQMHDEAFTQFELFMKMRRDLFEGRLAHLGQDAARWRDKQSALGEQYEAQSAFAKARWAPETIGGRYFKAFFQPAYDDGARIAKDFTVITPTLRQWRYVVDKEKEGEALGWHEADFDDGEWSTTDPCVETWSALGLNPYYGPMFYRAQVNLSAVPAGKKVYLWISSTDGSAKVFVNGQHISYVSETGEKTDEFTGYCQPASFEITAAAKPEAQNQITIMGTRTFLNEIGTGGLIGPVVLYREK